MSLHTCTCTCIYVRNKMDLLLGLNFGEYKQEMAYFLQHASSHFPSLPLDGITGGSKAMPFLSLIVDNAGSLSGIWKPNFIVFKTSRSCLI